MVVFSSLVLFIAPQWNVAYWTGWRVLGMAKADWSSLHMNLGIVMLCAALLHIYLNWVHITRYMKNRVREALTPSWELAVALLLTVAVIAGSNMGLPPLKWTTDVHKDFQSRVADRDGVPPINYTELMPLGTLTQLLDLDLEMAMSQLAAAGMPAAGPQTTILQVALANHVSPQTVYQAMVGEGVEALAPDRP
jgi:hypothetical protein